MKLLLKVWTVLLGILVLISMIEFGYKSLFIILNKFLKIKDIILIIKKYFKK
jgi:hypothetical protein